MNKTMNVFHNGLLKWEADGKLYVLHVQQDTDPVDPRQDYDSTPTVMACFHRRYKLGDDTGYTDPDEFWNHLVKEHVTGTELVAAAKAGKLPDLRLEPLQVGGYNIYATVLSFEKPWRPEMKESLLYECIEEEDLADYLLGDLTIRQCQAVLEPYMEWLPLWLYDHSGISMSAGARSGQYADRWDSGQVGWILCFKEEALKNFVEYVLDENGEKIKEEHPHEGQPSTWSYKTRPLTEETWRARAIEVMEEEVKLYDMYLTDEVYGYTLYSADPTGEDEEDLDWEEQDSVWGFFGSNILESGLADEAGCGLLEAIEAGTVRQGTAEEHSTVSYSFAF